MSLIRDEKPNGLKQHKAKMVVETQSFGDTFGPKAQRKRVKLGISTFDDLVGHSEKAHDTYTERLEEAKLLSGTSKDEPVDDGDAADWNYGNATLSKEAIFSKGQSKRIWNELYKVLDSSDVVLHVLDARDPLGTRCRAVEKYLREEAPHKHLVFILNKCDLVPTKVAVSPFPSCTSNPHTSWLLFSRFAYKINYTPLLSQGSFSASLATYTMRGICYNFGRAIAGPPFLAC